MKIKYMYKIIFTLFAITILLSCNKSKEEQLNDYPTVGGYKIVPVPTPKGMTVEELDNKAVNELYKNGIVENSKHKLEFFFYCSTEEQAKQLTDHLNYMTYTAKYQRSVDGKEFAVVGYTDPFPINAGAITRWGKAMDKVAEKYKSKFDGWQVAVK